MDILSSGMPERFDLRESNKVTRVKDQAPWGTCWTFGSLGSAESSALGQNWNDPDFSKSTGRYCAAIAPPKTIDKTGNNI